MTPLAMILIVALVVVVVAFGAYIVWREWRSKKLRSRFGPEYSRTVKETGSRGKAESRLKAREERVEKFHIRPLTREQKVRYLATWQSVQAEFVDDPRQAVRRADALLGDIMAARGYPVNDFEQRSADLSVDHPQVVQNYRNAHAIASRHERGEAGTEELRQAMIHYRTLFDELVAESEPARVPATH
jgi:ABC-type nickel/cobalt efflux system permease component RcnA